jgi:hypothetical protein
MGRCIAALWRAEWGDLRPWGYAKGLTGGALMGAGGSAMWRAAGLRGEGGAGGGLLGAPSCRGPGPCGQSRPGPGPCAGAGWWGEEAYRDLTGLHEAGESAGVARASPDGACMLASAELNLSHLP